jgi:hypothetical protein
MKKILLIAVVALFANALSAQNAPTKEMPNAKAGMQAAKANAKVAKTEAKMDAKVESTDAQAVSADAKVEAPKAHKASKVRTKMRKANPAEAPAPAQMEKK